MRAKRKEGVGEGREMKWSDLGFITTSQADKGCSDRLLDMCFQARIREITSLRQSLEPSAHLHVSPKQENIRF